jgi:hypothetical protein
VVETSIRSYQISINIAFNRIEHPPSIAQTKAATNYILVGGCFVFVNGEGGIRTHGKLPYTAFPVLRHRPLGHFSKLERILPLD